MATNLKQLRMDDFCGVDFSSSPLKAYYKRAVSGKNWIREYGAIKKRNGFNQIFLDSDGEAINGLFPFEHGGHQKILVVLEHKILVYDVTGDSYANVVYPESYLIPKSTLNFQKTTAFYSEEVAMVDNSRVANKKIYLATGDGYMMYSVNDNTLYDLSGQIIIDPFTDDPNPAKTAYDNRDKLFIPTTTISINAGEPATDTERESYDHPNLLTPFRINSICGSNSNADEYYLDAEPDTAGAGYVCVIITYSSGSGTNTIYLKNGSGEDGQKLFNSIDVERGSIDGRKIKFNQAFPSPVDNVDNIFVVFAPATGSGSRNNSRRWQIGTSFGIGGSSDRVFIADNVNRNRLWFSEEDKYSYFPVDYYADIGSSSTAITAFLRLSDGTLVIFKEDNGNEPSVYYMTGSRDINYDERGVQAITPVFSFTAGSTSETAVNAFVTGNLVGDSLITSKNGVFAISLTENYATNTRTARERSRLINTRLQNIDLSQAVSVIWKGKYYLAVNGKVFIADSGSKWQPEDSEWWQYEWYYWEDVPVRVWAVVGDVLMFGTADGRICAFNDSALYADRKYLEAAEGSIDVSNDTIAFSDTIKSYVKDGAKVIFTTTGIYRKYSSSISKVEGWTNASVDFKIDNFENLRVLTKNTIFFLGVVQYQILSIDRINETIQITENGTDPVEYSAVSNFFNTAGKIPVSYYEEMTGKEFYIVNAEHESEGGTFQLAQSIGEDPIDIEQPGETTLPETVEMNIYTESPVVAEWKTPVFDMGTNTHRKTLLRLTVSADNVQGGSLQFGYETRQNALTRMDKGIQTFALEPLDFANFTLDLPFASSYTVRARERGFNYIQFYFRSESNTNCIVNNMTATYRIIAENRGVR